MDTSKAPAAAELASPIQRLCEEWYPKVHVAIFGDQYPRPTDSLQVVIEPKVVVEVGGDRVEVPAYAHEGVIRVSSESLARMRDDYRGMLVHELTHISQRYRGVPDEAVWIREGIADYVRHKYYEKDIEAKLRLGPDGRLKGYPETASYLYGLQENRVKLAKQGYRQSYTVAAAFLFWLEEHANKNIVPVLNLALREHRYSERLFGQFCGAPLDDLWRQFFDRSLPHQAGSPPRSTPVRRRPTPNSAFQVL